MTKTSNHITAKPPSIPDRLRAGDRLLTVTKVATLVDLAPKTIYARADLGRFPHPITLDPRGPGQNRPVRWWESDIVAWIESCAEASRP